MTPLEIAEEAISRLNKRITDEIFLIIQNDKDLTYEYLRAVEKDGLDIVNQTIGKKVMSGYKLVKDGREENPKSTLIQSHQRFR